MQEPIRSGSGRFRDKRIALQYTPELLLRPFYFKCLSVFAIAHNDLKGTFF